MSGEDQLSRSTSPRVIEDGEMYDHAEYGRVEVTAIWRRTQRLATAVPADREDMVVIRFRPGEDGEWTDELAEPLDGFFSAID